MKFKVGDRAKMTEMNGGYDFSNDPITGYVTVAKVTPNYYECFVEGYDDPVPLCFYESELIPINEEEEKKEKIPKYKVGDVVKMNDKHPYYFDGFEKMDGTMTVEEVHYTPYSIPLYLCSINGYTDEVDKEVLMYKGCLNFKEEWIDGYADKDFKPSDIVKIKGDHEDFTMSIDGLYGIVTEVEDDDCEVAVYSPIAKRILYWQVWKRNMTKC